MVYALVFVAGFVLSACIFIAIRSTMERSMELVKHLWPKLKAWLEGK